MGGGDNQTPKERIWRREKRPEMKAEKGPPKLLFIIVIAMLGWGYWSLRKPPPPRVVTTATTLPPTGELKSANELLFQETLYAPDMKLTVMKDKLWPLMGNDAISSLERHVLAQSVLKILGEIEENSREAGPKLSSDSAKLRLNMFLDSFGFLLKTRPVNLDPAEVARPFFVIAAPMNHEEMYKIFYDIVSSTASLSQLRESVGQDRAAAKAAATGF